MIVYKNHTLKKPSNNAFHCHTHHNVASLFIPLASASTAARAFGLFSFSSFAGKNEERKNEAHSAAAAADEAGAGLLLCCGRRSKPIPRRFSP